MIPLIINGKRVSVPQITELTVPQFCKLMEIGDFNLIDYIGVVLDMERKIVEGLTVKNPLLLANQLYGYIPDYSKVKSKFKKPDFTLGQRFLIEENGKAMNRPFLDVFIYETYTGIDTSNKLASEIMPDAFFLFKSLRIGSNLEPNYLARFLLWLAMPKFKNKREVKS